MSHGLTSIVHCDAAVWGWSVGCYLRTLFWVLLVGQLWEGERNHFLVYLGFNTQVAALAALHLKQMLLGKEASQCLCSIK